jgi:hypothetical protein
VSRLLLENESPATKIVLAPEPKSVFAADVQTRPRA